jgi:hypothetical protein
MNEAREQARLAEQVSRVGRYDIRTHVIAQVVSYDSETNLAIVQPVNKAVRFTDAVNPEYIELGTISDVPVAQLGSGKLWCTVAPAAETYGLLHISDRTIDEWLELGGVVEPKNIRCHNLSDAIFYPSLLPKIVDGDNGAFDAEDDYQQLATDRISLRTRSGLTQVSVLDGESVLIQTISGDTVTSLTTIDADGNITIESEGELSATVAGDVSAESTGGDVNLTAGGNVVTSSTETVIQDGTDYAVQFTAMKTAFDNLKSELNALVTAYNAHIHITTATVGATLTPGVIAQTTSTGTPPVAIMDGAKVANVRLP